MLRARKTHLFGCPDGALCPLGSLRKGLQREGHGSWMLRGAVLAETGAEVLLDSQEIQGSALSDLGQLV